MRHTMSGPKPWVWVQLQARCFASHPCFEEGNNQYSSQQGNVLAVFLLQREKDGLRQLQFWSPEPTFASEAGCGYFDRLIKALVRLVILDLQLI